MKTFNDWLNEAQDTGWAQTMDQTKRRWAIEAGTENTINEAVERIVSEYERNVRAVADEVYSEIATAYEQWMQQQGMSGWAHSPEMSQLAEKLIRVKLQGI